MDISGSKYMARCGSWTAKFIQKSLPKNFNENKFSNLWSWKAGPLQYFSLLKKSFSVPPMHNLHYSDSLIENFQMFLILVLFYCFFRTIKLYWSLQNLDTQFLSNLEDSNPRSTYKKVVCANPANSVETLISRYFQSIQWISNVHFSG